MLSPFLASVAYWLCIIGIAVTWAIYLLRGWAFWTGRVGWRDAVLDLTVAALLTALLSGITRGL